MFRFILPIIGIILILSSAIYLLIFFKKPTETTQAASLPTASSTPTPSASSTASSSPQPLSSNASSNEKILEDRLKNLEYSVKNLTTQVASLNQQLNSSNPVPAPAPAATTTSNTSSTPPDYITIGTNGQANYQAYTPLPGFLVTINTADFPGYTSAQLEATFRLSQPAGTGSLQLINLTTNQAISASTISSTSSNFQLFSSSTFQLTPGTNTYAVQMQQTDNYDIQVNTARLKINFD